MKREPRIQEVYNTHTGKLTKIVSRNENGQRHGVCKLVNPDGTPHSFTTYRNGTVKGLQKFFVMKYMGIKNTLHLNIFIFKTNDTSNNKQNSFYL